MAGMTLTQHIDAPVEMVFHLATDLDGWAGRIKGITKIERLTAGPVGVGTRFRDLSFNGPHLRRPLLEVLLRSSTGADQAREMQLLIPRILQVALAL